MLTELNEMIKHRGVTIRGFFPGTNPNATLEQVAEAINKALDQIEAGNFEEI